eukprot:gene5652-6750_t
MDAVGGAYPDYNLCRKWLREELEANGHRRDFIYDWFDHLMDNSRKPSSSTGS